MTAPERSWWGWGTTDQALPDDECVALGGAAARAARPAAPPCPGLGRPRRCRPSRVDPPAALAARDRPTTPEPGRAHLRQGLPGRRPRAARRPRRPHRTWSPSRAPRPTWSTLLDWAADAGRRRHPLRRRQLGGRRRGVPRRRHAGCGVAGPDRAWTGCWRSTGSAARRGSRAGRSGPCWRTQLRPHGLHAAALPAELRVLHARRLAGHPRRAATTPRCYTHIDDFVESLRVVTPAGSASPGGCPARAPGPSPDRLFLGSEGTLGVITEAWMRLQDRPRYKASASVRFARLPTRRRDAVRAIAQAGLHPANCRLLDPGEALLSGAARRAACVLVLGVRVGRPPGRRRGSPSCIDLARDHGGAGRGRQAGRERHATRPSAWRSAFLRMPYVRDGAGPHERDRRDLRDRHAPGTGSPSSTTTVPRRGRRRRRAQVTRRAGHRQLPVHPRLPRRAGAVLHGDRRRAAAAPRSRMWDDDQGGRDARCSTATGATITHHHAVGRDHRPGYDRQRPEPFAARPAAPPRRHSTRPASSTPAC